MSELATHDGLRIVVRVTPKGGCDAIEGRIRDARGAPMLKARIAAAPADGKANASLLSLLAEQFDVPRNAVTILRGAGARIKQVQIRGNYRALAARLEGIGAVR